RARHQRGFPYQPGDSRCHLALTPPTIITRFKICVQGEIFHYRDSSNTSASSPSTNIAHSDRAGLAIADAAVV
ncbi:MAG TPA: hypothetical protein VEF07_08685, partial [Candidatus Binataceae bacterium]|nr:hypothetical protein [Candidatus Binataceae bacterium]